MTWSFVTCPHTSDIAMCKKPGSNAFWFAVQPAGAVSGIGSVKINGKATSLIDSAFYFKLESSPGLDLSRVQFEVTPDSGGDAITATLDMSKDGCVSTGKQFGRSDGSSTAPPSSAAPPVSSKAPSTPVASTLEPTTTGSVITTLSPSPDVSTSEATAVPLPVSDSTTLPIDANDLHNETTTSPPVAFSIAQSTSSPNGVEISVQAQAEDQGLDLGYYLILAGGCVMAGVALAAIVHIRRKKWEDKDSDLDFNDAQTAIAAHRKFLATCTSQASEEVVSKFIRCVHHALTAIQTDNALVNSTFHDELLGIESDLIALRDSTHESIFPTTSELRRRRHVAELLRQSNRSDDPVGAILSQVEGKAVSTWEDKKLSLMDDDFMTFSTDDLSLSSTPPKPSLSAIRDQLGLLPNRPTSGRSLSASKSIEVKESLENELQALSSRLKHATHGLNQNLKEDAHLLDQVASDAEANQAKLEEENRKLTLHRKARIGLWAAMYHVVGLFVVFIGMYILMKIWSTRHYPLL
ncbi:hypothetical protein H310_10967 [Aphanomyces invadans]|uniref:Vesicle transport protein USE1 n=1 Tax=Aphanomyces invadans TaxID=157072 RepID=A0A024TNB3_9STRA|nr:hypothetical protein H310_10967 [Aphanomyces invadans]ETV95498.1 hypothetical protein H310_10967 [Aphanomyces invadans]|eukprot:XP_008875691.1 hypothetical protein H310_10967 [Aphanomyces invadans]